MALFKTKNYEEDTDTVTIPDFVEDKTDSKSVDMSIFKMSDEELYDDTTKTETENDEEDDENESGGKGGTILTIVLVLLLLACTGAAAFFAFKEHKNYVQAEANYKQLQAKENDYKNQLLEKDNLIASLNQQIEDMKKTEVASKTYVVVDGGMYFRKSPDSKADKTTFNGEEKAWDGDEFKVLEVVKDKGGEDMKWAKLAEDVYVCIEANGDVWAKEQ